MGERRGTRGLELWCKRMTEGYPGVKVENMTTSWRDGLAFCAIIHHFRPDLIDFPKLNKNDIYNNNNLAFRIAEDHLGIPALLEPEDMVEYAVPDRLSILTYLSQFYQVFAVNSNPLRDHTLKDHHHILKHQYISLKGSPTKLGSKRSPPSDLQRHMVAATGSSAPKKAALGVLGARKEPCAKCGLPVFIAERLNVRKTLYHRTCFRCAKCDSQLTLHNYTETENDQFCCRTCPDEDKATTSVLNRSLSDEEKSASLKGDSDPYSANFENVLEDPKDGSLKRSFTLDRMLGSNFVKARSDFMATQMTSFGSDLEMETEDKPPDLPVSQRPQLDQGDDKHSENIEVFSNNSLPNLSDNFSVDSDQRAPDQKQCKSQDRVTKDSVSAKDEAIKPSIRFRMKLFEGGVENRAKTDVNSSESLEKNDNFARLSQAESPEGHSENAESPSDSFDSNLSIHVSDEKVEADNSILSDPINSQAHSSILSVSSRFSDTIEEIVDLSSETSAGPSGDENSVIVISDTSEDSKCQPNIPPSENTKSPDHSEDEAEQPSRIVEYPDDLNPFGDDEEMEDANKAETVQSVSLNPFGDTDEEEEEPPNGPVADSRSLNPFGSDEDEENDEDPSSLRPKPRLRKLKAPKISLSPYWEEEDNSSKAPCGEEYESEKEPSPKPTPALRKLKAPRISLTPYWDDEYGLGQPSATCTSSSPSKSRAEKSSLHGSGRKKKPAPKPPSVVSSQSFKEPPKSRKTKRAPLPPTSTPIKHTDSSKFPAISPIEDRKNTDEMEYSKYNYENEKITEDKINRSSPHYVKRLTSREIDHDLELIEVQLRGLEKNGVKLEKIIREKTEIPGANPDDTLAPEIEDMILQLFELINDKHELFRKQTELMYLRRQNRLEGEQAEIENQLRCLMLQPDAHKTDSDKAREEELLNNMLEIVERRNEIVDRLEIERRRQAEEDRSISSEMSLYSMKRKGEHSSSKKSKKDKQKNEKDKEKSTKKIKGGVDKDIDESMKPTTKDKKKKRMLNIF